jgi:hypothetical protein
VKITRRPGHRQLGEGEAAQEGGDGRRVGVPLPGVTDEADVRLELCAVHVEEGRKARAAGLLWQASMKVITWPLSSEAPRATMISPERGSSARRGAKGGVVHSSKGSAGCTS